MYITIAEAADYLDLSEKEVRQLVFTQKIKAVYDGKQYLVNKGQFDAHLREMEKYRAVMQEILNEPIPESAFVRDED
ncbi:DNA binding domain-containing protein, excisionase family [Amphibacillus marinus]|uniref:DNA binding domain-containing protein, excisionase family n=1 Tax=Amphibacillus marinus TaxID=872970 RepID=A0A1H8IP44_9BACI|nr:helix-turn-helix domain-containing protein [Amphibacillus marinus]SEN69448.1 DNA binding domain-containing protein, excisionase family [Amphibacillus marinus]